VKPKIAAFAALATVACGFLATACGGTDHEAHARSLYNAYRTAEDSRTDAEEELRVAFRDISTAAQAQDREAVLAAAQRGQLTGGLQVSRSSLALVAKELEIALDDPFLETRKNELEDVAKESADLAVKGELAIRRADHALAIALGLEPRPDQMFTTTTG
jgi:hypothetical protein